MANVQDVLNGANYAQAAKAYAENNKKTNAGTSGVDVDSFLQLLAAQLQNQDMMNPMKDTEFMGQLAQFTALQTTQEMNLTTQTSYAVSLVGKEATGATINDRGDLVAKTGTITGVSLFNGEPVFFIDDFGFYVNQLMSVGKIPTKEDGEGEGEGEGDDSGTGDEDKKPEHLPTTPIEPGQLPS